MNKTDLIEAIAAANGTTKAETERFVDQFIAVITDALVAGDSIRLVGFGSFEVAALAARAGRNPQTGKAITIPAAKRPKFKPGVALVTAVNNTR